MGLKMIVMVKQVPDTHNISGEAMKPDGTVNRNALPAIFNPEDLNALEEALKIKEKTGGFVTAISMGPQKALDVLKECLYRGADNVVLVTDRRFAGADTLATSYALKRAIETVGKFDLVL
ncbi:MAG: electron transfer flavoprotein beta subunit/FixA family protein, partial [Deltaproteobacteria bacterium]|nr:electron transfer flavoprotein beta subunit/FixA family protein [Deltaproteobacteria bacterium]